MNEAILTEQVSFKIDHFQLKDISLAIPNGKITSIIGPNGSGKSTLLKIISKLLRVDKGSIYVNNINSKSYKSKEFARTIAMLPQSKDALPNLTVKELVAFGRSPYKKFLYNRSTEEDERIINEAIEMTNVLKHKNRLFYSLSGGEQQRVRLAMALAQKTDILLLDEPTTFLDISHQFDLLELLHQINETYNITIVMVLHDLQQAAAYSDYIIAMKNGKLVNAGFPKEMLTSKFLRDIYNLEARILFEDNYPLIIPNIRRK